MVTVMRSAAITRPASPSPRHRGGDGHRNPPLRYGVLESHQTADGELPSTGERQVVRPRAGQRMEVTTDVTNEATATMPQTERGARAGPAYLPGTFSSSKDEERFRRAAANDQYCPKGHSRGTRTFGSTLAK